MQTDWLLAFLQVNTATALTSLRSRFTCFFRAPRYVLYPASCRCEFSTTLAIKVTSTEAFPLVTILPASHYPLDVSSAMPTSAMENDSSALPSRKCAASSALQLGPRKKVCAIVINPIFLTMNLFYIRTTQDPLVHHGRHFGRTVHAFCNVQTLITNGL